jgi:aminopeptidase N
MFIQFSYKNAVTEDFWAELGSASKLPVCEVMSGWTARKGFPIVNTEITFWDENELKIKLTQSKFNAKGEIVESDPWKIPIAYTTSNHKRTETILMENKETTISIKNLPKNGWIKINAGVVGFYQVKYQAELFDALQKDIKNLSIRDRIGIEADLYACCKAGLVKSTQFLKVSN